MRIVIWILQLPSLAHLQAQELVPSDNGNIQRKGDELVGKLIKKLWRHQKTPTLHTDLDQSVLGKPGLRRSATLPQRLTLRSSFHCNPSSALWPGCVLTRLVSVGAQKKKPLLNLKKKTSKEDLMEDAQIKAIKEDNTQEIERSKFKSAGVSGITYEDIPLSEMGGPSILEGGKVPVKAWTRGVPMENDALTQVNNIASLDFIHSHVAVMPDAHIGMGATIGTVVPTIGAVIPAAVGVDIGCGMMAVRTSLDASQLPDNLGRIRSAIEQAVPHGRTGQGGKRDKGAWQGQLPQEVSKAWSETLATGFTKITNKHSILKKTNNIDHLGTLGTGNHFIELCLDEQDRVWIMLHSGSRGVGNKIGTYFIEKAKKDMEKHNILLPDKDLAYLKEGSQNFDDYVEAVGWAQNYARTNREVMMQRVIDVLRKEIPIPFEVRLEAVNCHHNYVQRERHFGKDVLLTRKGAVRAGLGEMGIIPGSMGAKSFIVRGLGNAQSFCTCSHGAGRVMSRMKAKKLVSMDEHKQAVAGVECRIDKGVIDETPSAYKPIERVMAAQSDLVEVVHTLKQVVCVKG